MRPIAACLVSASLAFPALAGAGEVRYGGSSTLAATIVQGGLAKSFAERTGVAVRVVDISGTGKGLAELAAGSLQVAGAGRPLSAAEKKAGLVGTVVGHDGLAVYVNRKNPVKDLTRGQLRDIYTGKATSWKELGGRDVRVVPLTEPIAMFCITPPLVSSL